MDIKNVIATLKNGILFTKKNRATIYTLIVNSILMILLSLITLISVVIMHVSVDSEMIVFIVGFLVLGMPICFYFSRLIIVNNKIKKRARIFLEDAIMLKARTKTIDVRHPIVLMKEIQIMVEFELEGQKKRYISGDGGTKNTQYQKIYTKYADREIDIMYSKKYDEVLILKDKVIYTTSAFDDN